MWLLWLWEFLTTAQRSEGTDQTLYSVLLLVSSIQLMWCRVLSDRESIFSTMDNVINRIFILQQHYLNWLLVIGYWSLVYYDLRHIQLLWAVLKYVDWNPEHFSCVPSLGDIWELYHRWSWGPLVVIGEGGILEKQKQTTLWHLQHR